MTQPAASVPSKTSAPLTRTLPLISVAALFALWGIAQCDFSNVLYKLTDFFTMDRTQLNWIPVVLNVTYFLVAIPSVMFHRRFGYKLGIIVGLCLSSFGPFLLYPAIALHSYAFFAASVMVITVGWPFLETCLNPLAMELGPPKSAVRRLSFVQSFFPVGAAIGMVIANTVLNFNLKPSQNGLAQAVAQPLVIIGIGVLILALVIDTVRFPAPAPNRKTVRIRDELRSILARKEFKAALVAIFFCQLAQAICWGTAFYLIDEEVPGARAGLGADVMIAFCVLAAVGRFASTALMRWVEPLVLLGIAMVAAVIVSVATALFGGTIGVGMAMATSMFLSLAYPVIFGTAICDLGTLKKSASGLLVTFAGMGSAAELLVVNTLRGTIPIRHLILVEVPCFLIVLAFAMILIVRRRDRSAAT